MFCLTWLQLAAMPCVMAAASDAGVATAAAEPVMAHAMPPMGTTTTDHCRYCPPAGDDAVHTSGHADCSYPHDPQVDSRAGHMLGLALPAAVPVLTFVVSVDLGEAPASEPQPAAAPRTSLAVSYCRFLK